MSSNNTQTIIIKTNSNYGIWGMIIGFVGIFVLSFVLSPLAFILGLVGLFKGQIFSSFLAMTFSILGAITSPILMTFIGLGVFLTLPEWMNIIDMVESSG